ncbi:testis-specific serine/threonine-protein kinase 3-like [Haliotis rubra]|uniref:testis-specific serine/threonine-protein kinase 3-like n=1 Tax=Haliotis rubra TaxID=36100 RepID=UPI001EE505B0|nr:testis-specific serine/threonine-protein kinase 3-like [Haliotis rubra]
MSSDAASSGQKDEDDLHPLKDQGYSLGRQIGAGAYSRVLLLHRGHQARAVKVISKVGCPQDYLEDFLPHELDIFPSLQHENIVTCHEILESPTSYCIVMEYADGGSLLERLQEDGPMEEEEARRMFFQTARAVSIATTRGQHTEITLRGKKVLSGNFCGSAPYTAPEVLQKNGPYDAMAADVWSLGVILYSMLYFRMPFNDSDLDIMLQHQLQRDVTFPALHPVTVTCKTLIKAMLEPDVQHRATADSVLETDWSI